VCFFFAGFGFLVTSEDGVIDWTNWGENEGKHSIWTRPKEVKRMARLLEITM